MVSSASTDASRAVDAGSRAQAGSAAPVRTSQRQAVKHVATLPSVEAAIGLMALPLMVEDGKASSGLGSAAGSVSDGGSNSSGEGSKRSVKSAEMTARAAHARAGKVAKSQRRREVYKLRFRQAAHARKFKKSKKN